MKVKSLETKIDDLQIYSMKSNIVFYNIPEEAQEDPYSIVEAFMIDNLQIPHRLLYSRNNPGGKIRIDVCHRLGQRKSSTRPLIVKFVTQRGRDMVITYGKNLRGTRFAISEQLPPSTREKRAAQIPLLTELRSKAEKEKTGDRVKLIKDKLIVNSKINNEVFEKNPLDMMVACGEPVKFDNLVHSETIIEKGSVFQGHLYPTHTIAEATQALRSLAQNDDIAKNDHWIYAHNITGMDGQVKCGYSNDEEWKAGTILMELLKQKGLSEVILIVTRKYGGTNLGKKRFELIKKVAVNAIDNFK